MKIITQSVLILVALVILLIACTAQKELIRFESGNNHLILTATDITSISIASDAAGKQFVNVMLSDRGQQLVSEFTGKNINNTMSIISQKKKYSKTFS